LTANCILCRKSTDLSWEEDEPSAAMAEEDSAPAAEESAPLPQAETVAPAVEATLPEASIVEGEYTAQTQSSSRSSRGHRRGLIHISCVDRGQSRGKYHPRGGAR
jgi:hypothetical protein